MQKHEPASRLTATLVERFGGGSTGEFRRLSHDRLMEESQRRLANAVLSKLPYEERVATRLLDSARDYRRWESEHATLMQRIAVERLPGVQKAQLLNFSLSLIHRKALFEYLRDEQVRGTRRLEIMAHFSAHRDYNERGCVGAWALRPQCGELSVLEPCGVEHDVRSAVRDPAR